MSAELPGLAKCVPTGHPDAPIANVVVLHPNGCRIIKEGPTHWLERRRGGRSVACVAYDLGELYELRDVLTRYLDALDDDDR